MCGSRVAHMPLTSGSRAAQMPFARRLRAACFPLSRRSHAARLARRPCAARDMHQGEPRRNNGQSGTVINIRAVVSAYQSLKRDLETLFTLAALQSRWRFAPSFGFSRRFCAARSHRLGERRPLARSRAGLDLGPAGPASIRAPHRNRCQCVTKLVPHPRLERPSQISKFRSTVVPHLRHRRNNASCRRNSRAKPANLKQRRRSSISRLDVPQRVTSDLKPTTTTNVD